MVDDSNDDDLVAKDNPKVGVRGVSKVALTVEL